MPLKVLEIQQNELPKKLQSKYEQLAQSLEINGIIPMLEARNPEFEEKFGQAQKWYAIYSYGVLELLSLGDIIPDQRSFAKIILESLPLIQETTTDIREETIRAVITDAISRTEDFFLLLADPKIDIEKPEYMHTIDAHIDCIFSTTLK